MKRYTRKKKKLKPLQEITDVKIGDQVVLINKDPEWKNAIQIGMKGIVKGHDEEQGYVKVIWYDITQPRSYNYLPYRLAKLKK